MAVLDFYKTIGPVFVARGKTHLINTTEPGEFRDHIGIVKKFKARLQEIVGG